MHAVGSPFIPIRVRRARQRRLALRLALVAVALVLAARLGMVVLAYLGAV